MVRLLSYLDTRIRLEGWEVELAIRVEAMRQFGEDAGMMGNIPAAASANHPVSAEPVLDAVDVSLPAEVRT